MESPLKVYQADLRVSSQWTAFSGAKAILALHLGFRPIDSAVYDFEWWTLTYQDVASIRTGLIGKYSPATANLYLMTLRGILKACWRMELISRELYERLIDVKAIPQGTEEVAGRSLSNAEVRQLLSTCESDNFYDRRDAALMTFLISTGLRRSELIQLNRIDLEEFTFAEGPGYRVRVTSAKRGGHRYAYVGPEMRRHLDRWLEIHELPRGPLFYSLQTSKRLTGQTIADILWRRSKKAEIEYVKPHDCRRTFVTQLLERGVDLALVSKLAGHASLNTTAIYDRRTDDALSSVAGKFSFVS